MSLFLKILARSNMAMSEAAREALAIRSKRAGISRIRNRCIETGRARGVIKDWGLSRLSFKRLADQGKLPGVRRSSW